MLKKGYEGIIISAGMLVVSFAIIVAIKLLIG
jgi:hypothetical protein